MDEFWNNLQHFVTLLNSEEQLMNSEELIKHATKRLEAMGNAITGGLEILNDIYSEREKVLYLLWLSEKEKSKERQ